VPGEVKRATSRTVLKLEELPAPVANPSEWVHAEEIIRRKWPELNDAKTAYLVDCLSDRRRSVSAIRLDKKPEIRAALDLVGSAPTVSAWSQGDRPRIFPSCKPPCKRLPHRRPFCPAPQAGLGRVLTIAFRRG
jgi:hypothetical protein